WRTGSRSRVRTPIRARALWEGTSKLRLIIAVKKRQAWKAYERVYAQLSRPTIGFIGLIDPVSPISSISHIHFLISLRLRFERKLLIRIPQLVPGEAFFAVGRFASENGHERALDAVFSVVAVFVFALALAEHAVDEGQRLLVVMFVLRAFVLVGHRR